MKEIAIALLEVQKQLTTIGADATNPFFKSKYATLAHIWDIVRPIITKVGLSVIQMPINDGDKVGVETTLLHTSGQSITGKVLFTLSKNDPQGAGSAITYARRYALCGILGITIADEDDDANSVSQVDKIKQAFPPADKTTDKSATHYAPIRQCEICGTGIDDRPANHTKCLKCFKSGV